MRNVRPRTLLLVMMAAVPVIVVLALVAAVLLERAGFGFAVWALAPFAVSMGVILLLGVFLGRSAARSSEGRRSGGDDGV